LSINYYRIAEGQEDGVCNLIHGLIAEYGRPFETELSSEGIRENAGFLNVEVAELDGAIIGFCAWTLSFSTWRGVKGIYIADLFATPGTHNSDVSTGLLLLAAKSGAAEGAKFIRAEVDITNEALDTLFIKAGFWNQTRHVMYFMEPANFRKFTS
jgi:hypothetical protein